MKKEKGFPGLEVCGRKWEGSVEVDLLLVQDLMFGQESAVVTLHGSLW